MPDRSSEKHVGFLIDVACVRKSPAGELLSRATEHSTSCALMGHCVESGFALIDDDGRIQLLEPAATTDIVRELMTTDVEAGVRLRVVRERHGEEMHTVEVAPGPRLPDRHADGS